MALDLDGYLRRIGWHDGRAPTLATLSGLLRAHMLAIPFENLDVLLGRGVRIDLAGIEDKLVRAGRGGYCFEHATLFAAVLEALGFAVARHSARVVLFSPPTDSPRGHMFLTVALSEGRFVVDPGFGGPASLTPVPLADASPDPHASHWMARDGDTWILRSRRDGEAFDAWVSTLEVDHPVDFEMANHFTITHPLSPFVSHMMLSRFIEGGRVTVMNRDVNAVGTLAPGASQLSDRAALRALLRDHFGFDLPEVERMRVAAIPDWD